MRPICCPHKSINTVVTFHYNQFYKRKRSSLHCYYHAAPYSRVSLALQKSLPSHIIFNVSTVAMWVCRAWYEIICVDRIRGRMRVISMYDIVTWLLCDAVFAFSITMFQLWLNYVWLKLSLTLYWLASFSVSWFASHG